MEKCKECGGQYYAMKGQDICAACKSQLSQLRDEFAMAAVQHMNPLATSENIAKGAYDIADAMLKERKRNAG